MFATCQENKAKLQRSCLQNVYHLAGEREVDFQQADKEQDSWRDGTVLRWQEAGRGVVCGWGSRPLGVSGEQSWGAGVSCRSRRVRKGSEAVEQVLCFVL